MTTWCIIVNRQTCTSGWKNWETFLVHHDISYSLHHTDSIEEARQAITGFYENGSRHFLFVGGDGTIHHAVNILMQLSGHQSSEITFGVLPCGTGNDSVSYTHLDVYKRQVSIWNMMGSLCSGVL